LTSSTAEAERAKTAPNPKVRARVQHPIGIIKLVFGFVKVRHRGLKKNVHHLLMACALANLFISPDLLRCDVAQCTCLGDRRLWTSQAHTNNTTPALPHWPRLL
jgi:hypothetical protein